MYYFLGLTLTRDILNGSFWPSYVLCRARTTSSSRTGLRVIKQLDGKPSKNLPRILVTELIGHDDLLDFMSVYQTQDEFKGVHYHPEGALCWYSCNQYGDPTGTAVFVRRVPVKSLMWDFRNKRKFRMRNFNRTRDIRQALSDEPGREELINVRPVLYQAPAGKLKGKKRNGQSRSVKNLSHYRTKENKNACSKER